MHFPKLLFGLAVIDRAVTLRFPVAEVWVGQKEAEERALIEKRQAAAELSGVFQQHNKRIVCIEDTLLEDLQNAPDEATPFCSDFLDIPKETASVTVTTRTTVTFISTTVQTVTEPTATVFGSTVTLTETDSAMRKERKKRQAAEITPVATYASLCSERPEDSTLISRVKSGCSCLFITPSVEIFTVVTTFTRSIGGLDYQQTSVQPTTTIPGLTTVTVTVRRPSLTGNGTETRAVETPSSSSSFYSPVGTAPSSTSPSPTITSTFVNFTSPASTLVEVSTSSSTLTFPSISGTSASTSSGNFTLSTISTSSGGPSGGPSISVDTRSITLETSSLTSVTTSTPFVTVTVPPSSVNRTSSAGTGTGTSASASATGTPLAGCPDRNGTTYITKCQEFLFLCYTNFAGPILEGLEESTPEDCVEECAEVNYGFSEDRCYGLAFVPNTPAGQSNCFLKTDALTQLPIDDRDAVGAILISNDTCTSSTTNSVTSTASATLSPSTNGTYTPPPFTQPPTTQRSGQPTSPVSSGASTSFSSYANSSALTSGPPSTQTSISGGPTSSPSISFPTASRSTSSNSNSSTFVVPPFSPPPTSRRSGDVTSSPTSVPSSPSTGFSSYFNGSSSYIPTGSSFGTPSGISSSVTPTISFNTTFISSGGIPYPSGSLSRSTETRNQPSGPSSYANVTEILSCIPTTIVKGGSPATVFFTVTTTVSA